MEEILLKYENAGDYETLLGFKNEIYELVSASNEENGEPLFEEYSQGFQYLCNLAGYSCYTVTGEVNGEIRNWNIVMNIF